MAVKGRHLRQEPSWEKIAEGMKALGWYPEEISDRKVVLERGKQKLVAVRLANTNKWKIMYFSGRAMDDITGFDESRLAKALLMEMSLFK